LSQADQTLKRPSKATTPSFKESKQKVEKRKPGTQQAFCYHSEASNRIELVGLTVKYLGLIRLGLWTPGTSGSASSAGPWACQGLRWANVTYPATFRILREAGKEICPSLTYAELLSCLAVTLLLLYMNCACW